jgi:hypothetical protein
VLLSTGVFPGQVQADDENILTDKQTLRSILYDSTCHYTFIASAPNGTTIDSVYTAAYSRIYSYLHEGFSTRLNNWHEADSLMAVRLSNVIRVNRNQGHKNLEMLPYAVTDLAQDQKVKYLICFYDFSPEAVEEPEYNHEVRKNVTSALIAFSTLSGGGGYPTSIDDMRTLEIKMGVFEVVTGNLLYHIRIEEKESELESGLKELTQNVFDKLRALVGISGDGQSGFIAEEKADHQKQKK